MREKTVLFGKTESLVGIITEPDDMTNSVKLPAVVLLDSGLIHRVGHNRLYVKIARNLAAMGFVVLRFDFSGMGDSGVRRDHLSFKKSAVSEAQEAMSHLSITLGIEQFVLMGICSGAAISYETTCCDSRVMGAILINGRGHLHGDNEELGAYLRERTLLHHYWRILLYSSFRKKNWGKALTGKILDYRSILKIMFGFPVKILFRSQKKASPDGNDAVADIQALIDRGVHLSIIHAEADEGLDYLHVILGKKLQTWIKSGKLKLDTIEGANHTFTLLWSQEYLVNIIHNWAQEIIEIPQ